MADWQVGDLALCVKRIDDDAYEGDLKGQPIVGVTYTVTSVQTGWDYYNRPALALGLAEIRRAPINGRQHIGYNSICFRKITPPQADAFDREVIEAMRGKPVEAV